MAAAVTEPSALRVPVTVTVWLFARSETEPATCFCTGVEGAKVMVTLHCALVTVIDVAVKLVTVPRASACAPALGVAPGLGQTAAFAFPLRPGTKPPEVERRAALLLLLPDDAAAATLFWPTLYPP